MYSPINDSYYITTNQCSVKRNCWSQHIIICVLGNYINLYEKYDSTFYYDVCCYYFYIYTFFFVNEQVIGQKIIGHLKKINK